MTNDVRNVPAALDAVAEAWQPHRLTRVNDHGEVSAALIEPRGTVNTGDAGHERTAEPREL
jgi:hypothetical protein